MIGLKYIRKQYDLSLEDISKTIGVSRQFVSKWEKEEKKIPKKHIPKLSDFFNIDEKYFQKEIDKLEELEIENIKFKRDNQLDKLNLNLFLIEQTKLYYKK